MENKLVTKIIENCAEQASQYASAYDANTAEFRSALEAQHFVMLVNQYIAEIKATAEAHRNLVWSK
jgi:undecaprenyl pyrophosphate synthase